MSAKVLLQQCNVYWQSKCQILVKSDNVNNSYGGFCEVSPKREVSSIEQSHGKLILAVSAAYWEILL